MRDIAAREGLCSAGAVSVFSAANCNQAIHHRFEQQSVRFASDPAVRLAAGDITYTQLNAAANCAAHRLRAITDSVDRSKERQPVALLLDQGYESIVWTLAVLKAGLCYAPLDPRLPLAVLQGMLDHLDPSAVVADAPYLDLAHDLAAGIRTVIDVKLENDPFSTANLDLAVSPDTIAYIFYTSGSTGAPKGVADCHRNVLHNIRRYTNTLKFAPGDVLSLVQNPSFSGTVSSLFGALLNGAAIAPYNLSNEGLPPLSAWLRRSRVTVFHSVPSIYRQLSDPATRFPNVRLVRLEGDRTAAQDIAHFQSNFQDHCTLVNGLGATECGLVRQFFINARTRLNQTDPVPIGYPVPGVTVRVVDERGTELPPETTGEIVVESEYLAAGYWRDPPLTNEKFTVLDSRLRRYRTGDLGRMSADGCLFHLGRVDHRLRIAGEFVVAAEIEAPLLNIAGVTQCAVRDFNDQSGERRLCAYVVARADVTVTQLRQALSERLVQRLVPSTFILLDALPLTKDLKIDYERLPQPTRQRPPLSNDYVPPRTELEWQLTRLWSEVLEIDQVGVNDSFLDLGGDSLHAMRIVNRLGEKQRQAIQFGSLLAHGTIRKLAELLNDTELP